VTGTLLTTVEVAERLGLSSAAVAQAVRTGALQPTARTNDDFLFSERSVGAFAERRAKAAASPLQPPAAGSRLEWSGDVDRLNSWLADLSEAIAAPQASPPAAGPPPPPALTVEPPIAGAEPAEEIDFRRPPPLPPPAPKPELVAATPEPEPEPVAAAPEPEPVAAQPQPEPEPVAVEPEPVAAVPEPEPVAAVPEPEPVAAVHEPEPVAAAPEPEPVAAVPEPEPVSAVPEPGPQPKAVPEPVVATAPTPDSTGELFAVQPIVRFAILRQVRARIRDQEGVLDVRLERLENGVAWYRILHVGNADLDGHLAAALEPLGLGVLTIRGQG
jgi:hypothetical protein